MALSPVRRYGDAWNWLVSLFLIVVIWRFGIYGIDWKSRNSVATLLVVIAVLAFCFSFWRRRSKPEDVMNREDLTREFQDKKLRIEFVDGQAQQVPVNMVCERN